MLLMLFAPLAGALAALALTGRSRDWSAGITMSAALLLALLAAWGGPGQSVIAGPLFQPLPHVTLGLGLDGLSILMALVVTAVGLLIVLYSNAYFSRENREHPGEAGKGRYFFFLLLFVFAMLGLAMAPDFFTLFVFWELTTLCSWALIGHYESKEARAASFKALAMTQLAGLCFAGALVLLYLETHSFDYGAVALLAPGKRSLLVVLLLVAAWGKAAQAPFFTWLPSAMAAPTPASAFLHAAAMVKAGIFLTARVLLTCGALAGWPALLTGAAALVTLYLGVAAYIYQDDLKRLLAYSTICNLALMLIGLALGAMGSAAGAQGALLHLWNHAFTKTLLFLSVGAIAYATGVRQISRLSGIMRTMPLAGSAFLAGALAISGLPPFGIFWSKLLILRAALAVGGGWGWSTAVLVVVESGFSLAWFLWVAHRVLFGRSSPEVAEGRDPPLLMRGALSALLMLILAAPYAGMPLVQWVLQ